MRRFFRPITFVIALLLAADAPRCASATTVESKEKDTIKVGLLLSLSGVAEPNGTALANGFHLAAEQNGNNIAGKRLEIITENDGSSPATAVGNVRKLLTEDKVDLVVGCDIGNVAAAAMKAANQAEAPLVSCATIDSPDPSKDPVEVFPWVAGVSPGVSSQTLPFGDWVYRKLHYKKIAIVAVDYTVGWKLSGYFQKSFEDAGGQIIQRVWVPLGVSDFTPFIKQIRSDADAIFLAAVGGSAAILPKQLKQAYPQLPIIGFSGTFDESTLPSLGDYALGCISSANECTTLDIPSNKKFVHDYVARYKTDPATFSYRGYNAFLLLQKAAKKLHGDLSDRHKLIAELQSAAVDNAPCGPIRCDGRGNLTANVYVRKVEKVGGKLQNTVIFTFPAVEHYWKYKHSDFSKEFTRDYPPCKHCSNSPS